MPTTDKPKRSRVALSPEAFAFRETIARQFRDTRAAKGLTLAQVAALMPGTTAPDYGKIEAGQVNCSMEKLRQACDALGLEVVVQAKKNPR